MLKNVEQYENLKRDIIQKTEGSYDLQKVKKKFESLIHSRRSLSRAKNLNDIFNLLEERDVLNSNNVKTLVCLGDLLRNEHVINVVRGYKKLYIEDETDVCTCGEDLTFILPITNHETEDSVEKNIDNLESAINNVASNIGTNWRILASELTVPEHFIDEIRDKYPTDIYLQALKVLEVWREYNGNEATLDVLKEALDARLCKMKGIGLHLLKPVIRVN